MGNVTNYNLNQFYGNLKNGNPLFRFQFFARFHGAEEYLRKFGIDKDILYYFKSATIPGFSLKTAQVPFFGTEFRVPGVQSFAHNWTATLLATQGFEAYNAFRLWQENISSLTKDGGGNKAIPDIQMEISVLDSSMQHVQETIVLDGVWVANVQGFNLAYAQGGQNTPDLQIEFRYQYNYIKEQGDPLGGGNVYGG